MSTLSYIDGPYRDGFRGGYRTFTQEALYALGGLAVVVYVAYALIVG